jgi:hypothetical protein
MGLRSGERLPACVPIYSADPNILLEFVVAIDYNELGIWSDVKLAIVRDHAAAYSKHGFAKSSLL